GVPEGEGAAGGGVLPRGDGEPALLLPGSRRHPADSGVLDLGAQGRRPGQHRGLSPSVRGQLPRLAPDGPGHLPQPVPGEPVHRDQGREDDGRGHLRVRVRHLPQRQRAGRDRAGHAGHA
ncbi:hypothetical protein ANANG_G00005820, partial [Anguilla anguilla]